MQQCLRKPSEYKIKAESSKKKSSKTLLHNVKQWLRKLMHMWMAPCPKLILCRQLILPLCEIAQLLSFWCSVLLDEGMIYATISGWWYFVYYWSFMHLKNINLRSPEQGEEKQWMKYSSISIRYIQEFARDSYSRIISVLPQ